MKNLDIILSEENLTKESFQNIYDRFWYSKEVRNKFFDKAIEEEGEKGIQEKQFVIECGKQVLENPETKEEIEQKLVERFGDFTGGYFFTPEFCKEQYERTL